MNLRPFSFCPIPLDLVGLAVENCKIFVLFTNAFELSECIDSRFDGGEDSFSYLLNYGSCYKCLSFRMNIVPPSTVLKTALYHKAT
jgi:hypothetical protein